MGGGGVEQKNGESPATTGTDRYRPGMGGGGMVKIDNY